MIKTVYTINQIKYLDGGTFKSVDSATLSALPDNVAESVASQIYNGWDIDFTVNGERTVIRWSAVVLAKYSFERQEEDRPIDEFCGEEGFKVRFKDGEYYAKVLERETNVFTLELSTTGINVSHLIATDNHEPVDLTGATLTVEGFTYSAMDFAYVKSVQQGEYTDGQVISVNVNVTKGDYSGVAVLTCTVNEMFDHL